MGNESTLQFLTVPFVLLTLSFFFPALTERCKVKTLTTLDFFSQYHWFLNFGVHEKN
jgi:hypothetical protein